MKNKKLTTDMEPEPEIETYDIEDHEITDWEKEDLKTAQETIPTVPVEHPFIVASRFLHENAKMIEEGAAIELIRQTNLDNTHTRLDMARSLRVAANMLDGTQRA